MTGIVKLFFPCCVEDSPPHNCSVWLAQRGTAWAQSSGPLFPEAPGIWGLLWSHSRNESLSVGDAAPQDWLQHCHCHHSSPHMPSSSGGQTGFELPARSAFTVTHAQQQHIGKMGGLRNRLCSGLLFWLYPKSPWCRDWSAEPENLEMLLWSCIMEEQGNVVIHSRLCSCICKNNFKNFYKFI